MCVVEWARMERDSYLVLGRMDGIRDREGVNRERGRSGTE
jgi:hypothetical protein